MLKISDGIVYKMCHLTWVSKEDRSEKQYVFMLVPSDKLDELEQIKNSMQDYNPQDYGIVVESGTGEPDEAVLYRINNEFKCNF